MQAVTTAMHYKYQLEYCFIREIVFAVQKQSIPMSINDFVEMTIFLCLIFIPFTEKGTVSEIKAFLHFT